MKTYIWSLPTRIFHWLLVIGLVTAYILGEEEGLLNMHTAVGYSVGILIIFRIIWGIAGPKYSRFRDFPVGLKAFKSFITDMNQSKSKSAGHNPAASVVMLGILLMCLMIVISGALLLASQGQGFFSSLRVGLTEDSLKEIHEIAVNVIIGLVILHLLGNLVDFIFNRKTGTLSSIFTGYKNVKGEGIRLNSSQVIIAVLWILAALAIFPYILSNQKISNKADIQEQQVPGNDEDSEHEND